MAVGECAFADVNITRWQVQQASFCVLTAFYTDAIIVALYSASAYHYAFRTVYVDAIATWNAVFGLNVQSFDTYITAI